MGESQTSRKAGAAGNVRQRPDLTITYTASGPTLEALVKELLRTALLPGQAL